MVFDESGILLEGSIAKEYTGLIWEIVEQATAYSKRNSETIKPETSLLHYFEEQVQERKLKSNDAKIALQIAHIWGDIVGEPIEKQSLKFFWLEECVGGGTSITNRLFQRLTLATL